MTSHPTDEAIIAQFPDVIEALEYYHFTEGHEGDAKELALLDFRLILTSHRASILAEVEEAIGEHSDACGDSPLKECNPDCPQKPLSDLLTHLKSKKV